MFSSREVSEMVELLAPPLLGSPADKKLMDEEDENGRCCSIFDSGGGEIMSGEPFFDMSLVISFNQILHSFSDFVPNSKILVFGVVWWGCWGEVGWVA